MRKRRRRAHYPRTKIVGWNFVRPRIEAMDSMENILK